MAAGRRGLEKSEFEAGPWRIEVSKSHILRSNCELGLEAGCPRDQESSKKCNVCRFGQELELPSLPEMVFPASALRLEHESGAVLEFLAMEALKRVNPSENPPKVAMAAEWSRQRTEGLQKVKHTVKPFDWTYTTDYKGTLSSTGKGTFQVMDTEERIDYEKLKVQERIAFYDEVILFEDELADNGAAIFSVKIRVMASGFFILSRFFLRVDGVLVRLNDTRFHHQAGTDYILREYTSKDSKVEELKVPSSFLTEPNKLNDVLPIRELTLHKITLPR